MQSIIDIGSQEDRPIVANAKDIFSVEGKVTIVTGGGTGIGESIAKEFGARGAKVLIASRNVENLTKVRDDIRKDGRARRSVPAATCSSAISASARRAPWETVAVSVSRHSKPPAPRRRSRTLPPRRRRCKTKRR